MLLIIFLKLSQKSQNQEIKLGTRQIAHYMCI